MEALVRGGAYLLLIVDDPRLVDGERFGIVQLASKAVSIIQCSVQPEHSQRMTADLHTIMTKTSSRTSTEELGGLRLALREDLTFTLQSYGGQTCYVVEDEAHGTFFRIGVPEYSFLSLLDGRVTVEQALAQTAAAMGPDAIREQDAASICKWLVDNQLALTTQSSRSARLHETDQQRRAGKWRQYLNPLVVVLKLGNPEPFLAAILPLTKWMFGPFGGLVWMLVISCGLSHAVTHWRELTLNSVEIVTPGNWLRLSLVWLGLKLCHEAAHGLCCLRLGGRVRESGLNTVLFIPLPFVDVTSAWRLPSKWQRMFVGAAGMYAELFLAALAVIVWSHSDSAGLRHSCVYVMLTGGILTVLFNANPLMRFDGYYILADWLELPNLANHAHQDLTALGKRILFGVKRPDSARPPRLAVVIRTYGLLSALWKITVTASMILAAEALFHGAGLVLALLATVLWVLWPLSRFALYIVNGNPGENPSRLRFIALASIFSLASIWCWNVMPWSEQIVLPAVVDYSPVVIVRSPVAGFVRSVEIEAGANVHPNQVLVRLENPMLSNEIAELRAGIAKSELRSLAFQRVEDISARQIEDENRHALRQKLAERKEQQTQLDIRATVPGHVIGSDLASLNGQFVVPGQTLFLIGDERTKQVQAMVSQFDIDDIAGRVGQEVEVTLNGDAGTTITARLTKVEPQASYALRHPALAATAGGPLAVRARLPSTTSEAPEPETDNHWELVNPHFVASAELPAESRLRWGAGQIGTVRVTTTRRTLGDSLTHRLVSWIDRHRTNP